MEDKCTRYSYDITNCIHQMFNTDNSYDLNKIYKKTADFLWEAYQDRLYLCIQQEYKRGKYDEYVNNNKERKIIIS